VYTGEFFDNQISGVGTFAYANGLTYTGAFRDGKRLATGREATRPDAGNPKEPRGTVSYGPAISGASGDVGN